MKDKFVDRLDDLKEFYHTLRYNPRYWLFPLLAAGLFFILLFREIFWVSSYVPPSPPTPKTLQGEAQDNASAAKIEIPEYTAEVASPQTGFEASFALEQKEGFQLLNRHETFSNPGEWRLILVQRGQLVLPTVYATQFNSWGPLVEEDKKIKLQFYEKAGSLNSKVSFDLERKNQFGLQLFSLPSKDFASAVKLAQKLTHQGKLTYLYRSQQPINTPGTARADFYYRLRVGFFESELDALEAGAAIRELFPEEPFISKSLWAVKPEYKEANGDLVDFRLLRNYPWMLTLPRVNSLDKALEQLQVLSRQNKVSLVMQRLNRGKLQYRIKVGFFETQKQAQKVLQQALNRAPQAFKNTQTTRPKLKVIASKPALDTSIIQYLE